MGKRKPFGTSKKRGGAGLVQLVGRNKQDILLLGTDPGSRLMTICFCCPCCCLWSIALVVTSFISKKLPGLPGVKVIRSDDCQGWGGCLSRCIFRAKASKKARWSPEKLQGMRIVRGDLPSGRPEAVATKGESLRVGHRGPLQGGGRG